MSNEKHSSGVEGAKSSPLLSIRQQSIEPQKTAQSPSTTDENSADMLSTQAPLPPLSAANTTASMERARPNSLLVRRGSITTSTVHRATRSHRPTSNTRIFEIESMQRLPKISDVPVERQTHLFVQKICHCCLIFDFNDILSEIVGKEVKQAFLKDCIDYIVSDHRPIFSIETVYAEIFKMFSINVYRILSPPVNPAGEAYDPEEDDPILDPAWPHLQLVYELFIRFLDSPDFNIQFAKKYIDASFVTEMLKLFDNEDPRERDLLKTALHRVYGKFLHLRSAIRKAVSNVFLEFIYETDRHNGIAELLEILGSIINGFAIPLKEEHKVFLNRVLIPLHKGKSFPIYYPQLSYCVSQFAQKDKSLADATILKLLKIWPVLNSSKQILFLTEIEELLDGITCEQFDRIKVKLFRQLALCISSPQFQVAERALYYWNNYNFVSLMANRLESVFPVIFSTLFTYSKSHWNKTIHGLAYNALKVMMDCDPKGFENYSNLYAKKEAVTKRHTETWSQIEAIAQRNLQSINEPKRTNSSSTHLEPSFRQEPLASPQPESRLEKEPLALVRNMEPEKSNELQSELKLRRKSILPVNVSVYEEISQHYNPVENDQSASNILALSPRSVASDETGQPPKSRLVRHEAPSPLKFLTGPSSSSLSSTPSLPTSSALSKAKPEARKEA